MAASNRSDSLRKIYMYQYSYFASRVIVTVG